MFRVLHFVGLSAVLLALLLALPSALATPLSDDAIYEDVPHDVSVVEDYVPSSDEWPTDVIPSDPRAEPPDPQAAEEESVAAVESVPLLTVEEGATPTATIATRSGATHSGPKGTPASSPSRTPTNTRVPTSTPQPTQTPRPTATATPRPQPSNSDLQVTVWISDYNTQWNRLTVTVEVCNRARDWAAQDVKVKYHVRYQDPIGDWTGFFGAQSQATFTFNSVAPGLCSSDWSSGKIWGTYPSARADGVTWYWFPLAP